MVEATQKTTLLNNRPLSEYTVVLAAEDDRTVANALMDRLGVDLPIKLYDGYVSGSVIRIGASYRNGRGANDLNGYLINNYTDAAGNVFCIDASSPEAYAAALDDLFSRTKFSKNEDTVSISLPYETVYSVAVEFRDGSNKRVDYTHWSLSSKTSRELYKGVTYTEQLFYDDAGLPYRVYTVVADTSLNKIAMGCSNDGFAYTLPDHADFQNTQQHMQAAVANGKNVIAAINGDFFDNSVNHARWFGDFRPWGLTVKDGRVISKGETELRPILFGTTENVRPFFAMTKDGTPVIDMESEYDSDEKLATLENAIGGAYILARDGKTNVYKYQHNIIHGEVHPRGLVGFCDDGKVVLTVIDGRQPEHSNGASLLQSSLLMHRFGASASLLLDGGGSSCMVLRDPETDTYLTPDKPCDGQLRLIYNSILVIAKDS